MSHLGLSSQTPSLAKKHVFEQSGGNGGGGFGDGGGNGDGGGLGGDGGGRAGGGAWAPVLLRLARGVFREYQRQLWMPQFAGGGGLDEFHFELIGTYAMSHKCS